MADTARPSSFVTSDLTKFILAWTAFLGLVVVCFGLAGVTSGQGFAGSAGAAAIGLAVSGSFVAVFGYAGDLIDRALKRDAVFRCLGGLVGLVCAACFGLYLYNHYAPVNAALIGGP